MRITISMWVAIVAMSAALSLAQPVLAQGHQGGPPILGYRVVLERDDGERTTGELIAVSLDSLWLLRDDALTVFSIADIEQVNVRQSTFGAKNALLWSLVAGTLSGAALTAACSSIEGNDCSGLFPIVLLSWVLIGGIAAASVEPARYAEFPEPQADVLRPYSRFPQGLPEGYRSDGSATERSRNGSGGSR